MRLPALFMFVLLATAGGCASYEYDITRPQEFAAHAGKATDLVFRRDPVEYRLRTVDSRLVVRIYNTTDLPMTLLGDRSSVVDPGGQSHPLPTQTLAPSSFIKIILPPIRPRVEPRGPTIGIGFGTMIGSAQYRRRGAYGWDAFDDYPRYLVVYDDQALYWDWSGESDIRLTLVFEQGQKEFSQEFVIARRKVK